MKKKIINALKNQISFVSKNQNSLKQIGEIITYKYIIDQLNLVFEDKILIIYIWIIQMIRLNYFNKNLTEKEKGCLQAYRWAKVFIGNLIKNKKIK